MSGITSAIMFVLVLCLFVSCQGTSNAIDEKHKKYPEVVIPPRIIVK